MFKLTGRYRYIIVAVGIVFVGLSFAARYRDAVRWRLHSVHLKTSGDLRDVGWFDVLRMGEPKSSITTEVSAGRALFRANCAICHGAEGVGGTGGPALRNRQMVHGSSDSSLFTTISLGVRGTAMPASALTEGDKWKLVAYVKTLAAGSAPSGGSTPVPAMPRLEPVTYQDIRTAGLRRDSWLTYSGSYDGHRFSPNNKIVPANAGALRLMWMRQYNTTEKSIETSPLVVGNYMFVTVPPNRVEALDARTGALMWAYERNLPEHLSVCCGYINRGLAVLGSTLFFGTLDAHLIALDMETGRVSWDVEIADYRKGYSITGAPLALKNLIVTGVAGGEFGIRGFVEARDAVTGKQVWRFDTVPQAGQPGSNTWEGEAWRTGGGPTWLTGSFDPESNLIYWPTGNPSPSWDGAAHAGDNLYSNCILALDADHGTLRWYFQFTPHDEFDWDATEIPVLIDRNNAGKPEHLLAQANRNAFFYVLDRGTGSFRTAAPFAKQTWADRIDSHGRPILNSTAHASAEGTPLYPGVGGATNWQSPSYSPMTGLIYVSALERGGMFYRGHAQYHPGELFLGGFFQFFDGGAEGAVRALNAVTGEQRWEYRRFAFSVGGLLSTAGGVVFGSQQESFFALDAETGRELWRINTGGRTVAAPITFLSASTQMVTVAAGHDILTFGL